MFYIRHYQHSNKGLGEGWWGSVHSAVTEQSSAAAHLLLLNLYLYLFTCTHFNYSRRWCIIRNSSHRTVTVSSENELSLVLKGYFSGPRYFLSNDGKRPEKIESETHFSKKRTEMRKNNKKGEIQTFLKIVVQPAVTSEKGVVFNPVRSGSGVLRGISEEFSIS